MISKSQLEYIKDWQKRNKMRVRMNRLRYYYRNRVVINMSFSKAISIEPDEADKWYAERNPDG